MIFRLISQLSFACTILTWRPVWVWAGTIIALLATHSLAYRPPALLTKQLPPPDCHLNPEPTDMPIRRQRLISLADRDAAYIELVVGGDELVVEFQSDQPISDWFSAIRISAKTSDYEGFRSVCPSMSPDAGGRRISLHVKTATAIATLWRVEVFALKSKAPNRNLELTFRTRKAEPAIESFFEAGPDTITATAFLCTKSKTLAAIEERPAAHAFGVSLVKVSFDMINAQLSEMQRQRASEELALALSMWSHACAECSPEHFAAIEIDGIMHVRSRLLDWYQKEFEEAPRHVGMRLDAKCVQSGKPAKSCFVPIISGRLGRLDESLESALEPISQLMAGEHPVPRGKLLDKYIAVHDAAARLPKLCSNDIDEKSAPLTSKIKKIVCNPSALAKRERAKLKILFREGAIGCDNSAETIACRVDPELTEYNIRDFRFSSQHGDQDAIGNGAVKLDLMHVLLHELGHWLGLGHADVGEGIMASSLRQARCIDARTSDALRQSAFGLAGLKGTNQTYPSPFKLNPPHAATSVAPPR